MQRYVNPNMSGCPCRTIGSIHNPHHSHLTSEGCERIDRGKIEYFHPREIRLKLGQNLGERVFDHSYCPRTIKEKIATGMADNIPIRSGWIDVMKKPNHGNINLFCVPTRISVQLLAEVYDSMFTDLSGLCKEGDIPPRPVHREPIWNWFVVSRNTRPISSGDMSLPGALMSHFFYRKSTGRNLFHSNRLVCNDRHGRRVVVNIDNDGMVSIPKCECPPGGDSHIHGVLLSR